MITARYFCDLVKIEKANLLHLRFIFQPVGGIIMSTKTQGGIQMNPRERITCILLIEELKKKQKLQERMEVRYKEAASRKFNAKTPTH